jgi:hypothetical protein
MDDLRRLHLYVYKDESKQLILYRLWTYVGSGLKPLRTGHKKGDIQLIAFTCRQRWAQPQHETGKAEQLCLLSCVQKSRNAGVSCYNVMPPPCGSNLFAAIKDP